MNQILTAVIIVPAVRPVSIWQTLVLLGSTFLALALTIIIIGCLLDLLSYLNQDKGNGYNKILDKQNKVLDKQREEDRRKKMREEFDKAPNW